MRTASRAVALLLLAVFGLPVLCQAQASGATRWVARTGVAFAPWTFDLKIEGGVVTGTASQATLMRPAVLRRLSPVLFPYQTAKRTETA